MCLCIDRCVGLVHHDEEEVVGSSVFPGFWIFILEFCVTSDEIRFEVFRITSFSIWVSKMS